MTFPESHYFEVTLERDHFGLGITVAGYVCEKEELSGIFIKSISPNRLHHLSGQVQVNDRIVNVNGQSVLGLRNTQAISLLRNAGNMVVVGLERYVQNHQYQLYANDFNTSRFTSIKTETIPNVVVDDFTTMRLDHCSRKSSTSTLVDLDHDYPLKQSETNNPEDDCPPKTDLLHVGAAKSDTSTTTTSLSLSMVSALVTLTAETDRDEYETCVDESLSDDVDLQKTDAEEARVDDVTASDRLTQAQSGDQLWRRGRLQREQSINNDSMPNITKTSGFYSSEPLLNDQQRKSQELNSYDTCNVSSDDELFLIECASKEDVPKCMSAPCVNADDDIEWLGSKDQFGWNVECARKEVEVDDNLLWRRSAPCISTTSRMWKKRLKWASYDHIDSFTRRERMTVTKKCFSASSEEELNMLENRWGCVKRVDVYKEPPSTSLGLSIVGGNIDTRSGKKCTQTLTGVFVKNVVADSPAGRTGQFKVGDKILEVNNIDLRQSTHEEAVNTIRNVTAPLTTFLIQPLNNFTNVENHVANRNGTNQNATITHHQQQQQQQRTDNIYDINYNNLETKSQPTQRSQATTINDDHKSKTDDQNQNQNEKPSTQTPSADDESDESDDDDEDLREYEGKIVTNQGIQIDRASAGNVKRTKAEIEADTEEEDEFGYTTNKIRKKYAHLKHTVAMVQLERGHQGLGLSLAGHKDRNCMAVFVCGLNPNGVAYRTGGIQVGDEILEVNGIVLHGRCHLNASAIIKGLSGQTVKVILLRRKTAIEDIAVRPITQFPVSFDEEVSEDKFHNYPNVRSVTLQKGTQSLGIMIIEGKHAEVGQGIFISDIQEGSSAEKAGLEIGEMILAVNKDSLLGANYDNAATLLKRTEGFVTLIVSNPGKKASTPLPDEGRNGKSALPSRATTPIPEPPQDPTTCPIAPGRETAIELATDNKGLGLYFIGGRDTHIPSRIIIVELYEGGAAFKDARLRHGDQILEANGVCLKDVSHETARQTLRQILPKMKLVIFRPETVEYTKIDVELVKKPSKGMGLCLMSRKDKTGVYASEILNGSIADADGRIMKGDIVMAVNGQSVDQMNSEDIGTLLKTASGKVALKLHRFKLSN